MKKTTISDLRVILTVNDVDYDFLHVRRSEMSDPRTFSLMGSPQQRTSGLLVEEGATEEVTLDYQFYEVPASAIKVMYNAWDSGTRITVKEFGRNSREYRTLTDAIIKTNPKQGAIEDGATADFTLSIAAVRNRVREGDLDA